MKQRALSSHVAASAWRRHAERGMVNAVRQADREKDRARQPEVAGAIGMEQVGIDTARPSQDGAETLQAQLFGEGSGGDHGAAPGVVKPAQPRPSPALRDRKARRGIVGESGM